MSEYLSVNQNDPPPFIKSLDFIESGHGSRSASGICGPWVIRPHGDRFCLTSNMRDGHPGHVFDSFDEAEAEANKRHARLVASWLLLPELVPQQVWQPIKTAPRGREFLALLSNGWRVILTDRSKDDGYFAWYDSSLSISIPIERTHRHKVDESFIRAIAWMDLPEADPNIEGAA